MGSALREFTGELRRLAYEPSWELRSLLAWWPAVEKEYSRRRERLLRSLRDNDPARLKVDLLNPIKRASDETLHTQALAYILNPLERHGFGMEALRAILRTAAKVNGRIGASRVLRTVQGATTRVSVTPEYHYKISGFRNKSVARSDIWIEMQARKESSVVVLENKLGAAESDGQLGWYELKAKAWCSARDHDRFLLIFLTPDGREPSTSVSEEWMLLSYLHLAGALRHVWRRNQGAEGASWLALYISSILHGVVGIDLNRRGGFRPGQIETYLGIRY